MVCRASPGPGTRPSKIRSSDQMDNSNEIWDWIMRLCSSLINLSRHYHLIVRILTPQARKVSFGIIVTDDCVSVAVLTKVHTIHTLKSQFIFSPRFWLHTSQCLNKSKEPEYVCGLGIYHSQKAWHVLPEKGSFHSYKNHNLDHLCITYAKVLCRVGFIHFLVCCTKNPKICEIQDTKVKLITSWIEHKLYKCSFLRKSL